jgi:formylmethanofuran dehydrogenase subunit E
MGFEKRFEEPSYDVKPITFCDSCGEDLYLTDDIYRIEDEVLCWHCFDKEEDRDEAV